MKKTYKDETFWAIYGERIGILPFTMRMTRKQCIIDFCTERCDWPEAKAHGYSAVKVKVEIL
jgi:hypothetical protein